MATVVNKFLTKTFHMISKGDQSIASWTNGGNSFTIHNIKAFEKESLPKYFNHSKFSSFVRQLNFYGFQKNILDTDLQSSQQITLSASFSHEFFRRGMPELLPKIQRSTKRTKNRGFELDDQETLQKQVQEMKMKMEEMQKQMDIKLESAVLALQNDYMARVTRLELTCNNLLRNTFGLMQGKTIHKNENTINSAA